MERAQALEEALAKLEDGASGRRYAYRRFSNETYLRYFLCLSKLTCSSSVQDSSLLKNLRLVPLCCFTHTGIVRWRYLF